MPKPLSIAQDQVGRVVSTFQAGTALGPTTLRANHLEGCLELLLSRLSPALLDRLDRTEQPHHQRVSTSGY